MTKWIVAEKIRIGLRHAALYPNVTGKTEKRIAQTKRARVESLSTKLINHKWHELVSSGRFCLSIPCRLSLVRRFSFVLFRFRTFAFTESICGPSFNRCSICMRPNSLT